MDTIQALLQGNGIPSRDPWQPTTPLYHLFIFHTAVLPERPEGGEHKQIQSMCVGKPTWLRKTCGNSAGLVFSPPSASYSGQYLTDVMLTKVPVSRMMEAVGCRPKARPGRNVPTSRRPFPKRTTAGGSGFSELLHRLWSRSNLSLTLIPLWHK